MTTLSLAAQATRLCARPLGAADYGFVASSGLTLSKRFLACGDWSSATVGPDEPPPYGASKGHTFRRATPARRADRWLPSFPSDRLRPARRVLGRPVRWLLHGGVQEPVPTVSVPKAPHPAEAGAIRYQALVVLASRIQPRRGLAELGSIQPWRGGDILAVGLPGQCLGDSVDTSEAAGCNAPRSIGDRPSGCLPRARPARPDEAGSPVPCGRRGVRRPFATYPPQG